MKRILFLLIFTQFSLEIFAIENRSTGARPLSLSNAFVSFTNPWSTFHNQAGLAKLTTVSAGIFYESRFLIDELSLSSGTFVLPVNSGTFALSFFQFGKGTYKEAKLALAYAKQLAEKWSAGVQLDYFCQTLPENKLARSFVSFEAGLIYSPVSELFLGAHLFNPVSAGIDTFFGKQKMPMAIRFGGHYQLDKTIVLSLEAHKNTDSPMILKTGIEFSPVSKIAFRMGVSGKSLNYTAGIGYTAGKITTDLAFSYQGNLGISPSVSIQIHL